MRYKNRVLRLGTNSKAILFLASFAGLIVSMMAVGLFPSQPAYADHNSTRIVCPDPISEGNSGRMGIRRSGFKINSAVFFTDHRYHTASSADYEEYHGKMIEAGGDGASTLWAPIVTKEDTLPEHDETFAMGFWDGGVWHYCVVTIADDDAPEILSVSIASSPLDRHAYRAGESIDIAVDLDQKVDVDDVPLLALFIGDDNSWRGAAYHSGSGTRSLIFRYRVQPEDFDPDGFTVGAAASNDDRSAAYGFAGNIYAAGTDVPINYGHPGVEGDWKQKVDGRPYVQDASITSSPPDGWDAYRANQTIEVSMRFDMDVVVEGDVSVGIYLDYDPSRWDEVTRQARYLRGSGTDTLLFGYTVRPGDNSADGIGLFLGTESTGFGGHGTIKAKGADVERNPYYLGTGPQAEHGVDTTPPAISSVSIASHPSRGDAYDPGELISAAVTFTEAVTFIGDPHLEFDVGGVARQAAIGTDPSGTYASTLTFHYTVQLDDTDTDGIGVGANRLRLNGGGIYDSAGNAADLSHTVVAADPNQRVESGSID